MSEVVALNTPETTARIASGLVALSERLARRGQGDPVRVTASLSTPQAGALARALTGAIRIARDATRAALDQAVYGKPLPAGLGEMAAALCESVAQAMRHIAQASPSIYYQDRLQLSQAASSLHGVYAQFAGPLRQLVTYASLDDLYGATLASNAMGGRPLSPLRGANAFAHLVDAMARAPVVITTDAAESMTQLIGSDPVLLPMELATVSNHLSNIANGARMTTP